MDSRVMLLATIATIALMFAADAWGQKATEEPIRTHRESSLQL
jgi:hypothetical protein